MHRRVGAIGIAAAIGLLAAACGGGGDSDTAAGSADDATSDSGGDFCGDLESVVTRGNDLSASLYEGGDDLDEAIDEYRDLAEATESSGPPELADDLATVREATDRMLDELAEIDDLSDPAAVAAAIQSAEIGPDMTAATDRLGDYARDECGFDPDAAGSEAAAGADSSTGSAEPPDPCTFFDPQLAADAAGVDVDVSDQDGESDVNLGAFATRSCSFANGQMALSTITFTGDVDDVRAEFVDNAESNDGTVLDVDLGNLPESTLVTEVDGALSVNVLDAPAPFGVGFTGLDDPAAAVAAAEALLAAAAG
jgi:hypothetical protein